MSGLTHTGQVVARGTFFTIQKAVPLMTAGGSIVAVESVARVVLFARLGAERRSAQRVA